MLKPKKKIGKQNLKEDKFIKFIMDSKSYLEENYTRVLTYSGVFIAVIVIFALLKYVNMTKREKADGILGIAQIEYSERNFSKAAQRLKIVLEDYGSTDEADQARFLLANIYYEQNRYEEAKQLYQEFIDSFSGNSIMLASAQAGLAACLEESKEFASAGDWYKKAAKTAGAFSEADNYRYLAGICYKKAGEKDQAKEQFEKLVNNSDKADAAETQLIMLNNM